MITIGQKPIYFTADRVNYTCNSGYSQQNVNEISCICDVENADDWSCTIEVADFENECVEG